MKSLVGAHEAGVTSLCQPRPHELVTGSYDNKVRLFDLRALRREPLAAFDTGGGVWRLKWTEAPCHLPRVAVSRSATAEFDDSDDDDDDDDAEVGGGGGGNRENMGQCAEGAQLGQIAAACMHGGVHVLGLSASQTPHFSSLLHYRGHDSIAYGVDWCCAGQAVASCSFYDHQLHFWSS
jgi:diphthamide biosynthesis protein 7